MHQSQMLEKIHETHLGYCEVQEQGKTSLTLARNVSTEKRLLQPAGCVQNTPEQTQRSHWFQ